MDRIALGEFLRTRRGALQPEDVGMPRGQRRRTAGLRREEVAVLAGMSPDYYSRIERGDGAQPSEQMIAALARGLHLSLTERDHLFALAGYTAPGRASRSEHVSPGMMRIVDRLADTPAQVVSSTGVTLVQTPLAIALLGDQMVFQGRARSFSYRWFTDPATRAVFPVEDHDHHSRVFTAQLREAVTRQGPGSAPAELAEAIAAQSEEFAALWSAHEVGLTFTATKRFLNAEVGMISLHCQTLNDPEQAQSLLVYTPMPGSEDAEKLELLAVIGAQRLGV